MKNKLKVMYEKPEVSDAELEKFMDFDQLLIKRTALIKKRKIKYVAIGTSAVVLVALISWWMLTTPEELQSQQSQQSIAETIEPKMDEIIAVDSIEEAFTANEEEQVMKLATPNKEEEIVKQPVKTTIEETEPVYLQSAPVEGYANLYAFFEKELNYPEEAIADSVQGTVTAHCIIGKDGKPKNIQIENSLGEVFDKEVIRIIEKMPAWNPATLNGNPMESKISLPLSFTLKTTKHD